MQPSTNGVPARVVAVVLAIGSDRRAAGRADEAFLPLRGKPVLAHSLAALQASPLVDAIAVVASPADEARCRALLARERLPKVRAVVVGGPTRAAAEFRALQALRPAIEGGRVGLVLIHDAARPVIRQHLLEWLVEGAGWSDACLPVLRAPRLLARVVVGDHVATLEEPRPAWVAQSPRAFDARLLLRSYQRAQAAGLDDADAVAVMRWAGHDVRAIPGDADNVEIASPVDLLLAERLLAERPAARAARPASAYTAYRAALACAHCGERAAHRLEFVDGLLAAARCEHCGHTIAGSRSWARPPYLAVLRRRVRSKPLRLVGEACASPADFLLQLPRRCATKPLRMLREAVAELEHRARGRRCVGAIAAGRER